MTKLIKHNKPSKPLTSFALFCQIGEIIAMSPMEGIAFYF